jgi:hypothetical protein
MRPGRELAIYRYLVLCLRKCGVIPVLPLHVSWLGKGKLLSFILIWSFTVLEVKKRTVYTYFVTLRILEDNEIFKHADNKIHHRFTLFLYRTSRCVFEIKKEIFWFPSNKTMYILIQCDMFRPNDHYQVIYTKFRRRCNSVEIIIL